MFYPYGYGEKPSDHDRSTELSWGRGLTPMHVRKAAPDEGGMYCGLTQPMAPDRKGKQRHGVPGRQLRG